MGELVKKKDVKLPLSEDLQRELEEKFVKIIRGIGDTLNTLVERGELSIYELQEILADLEPSFQLISGKWVLEILYSLLFKGPMGFNRLRELTGASSRSLSTKLKILAQLGYIEREVDKGPPLRTTYKLTEKGRIAALLSLPLLYFIAKNSTERSLRSSFHH